MNQQKGIFITLDGGEGVGKTRQKNLLVEKLPALYPGREFIFTREPGGTPYAEEIRNVIFSENARTADGKTMFGLFTAARMDHVRNLIKPALDAGKVVVCDRFMAATYAYQVYAMENPATIAAFQVHVAELAVRPDLTLILDMDPEEALLRVKRRAGEVTHFDERELVFHQDLCKGYSAYAKLFPDTTALIDASRSVEEVEADIHVHIKKLLG